MRPYAFHASAREEYLEAIASYDRHGHKLGDAFIAEVESAIQRIRENPEAWIRITPQVRRCTVKRFPYNLLYRLSGESIMIIAVMHQRRNPRPDVRDPVPPYF